MADIGKILVLSRGDYDATATYNSLDVVRYNKKLWCCKQDEVVGVTPSESSTWTMWVQDGETGPGTGDMLKSVYDKNGNDIVDKVEQIHTATATFTEAATRSNIESGETGATLFGKIKKFFSDLKPVAFTADYADLTGTPPAQTVDQIYDSISTNAQSGTAVADALSGLATVASSGDYTDLSNKPTTMTGATSSTAGSDGFVPAPAAGDEGKYLRGDGTWDASAWSDLSGAPFKTIHPWQFLARGVSTSSNSTLTLNTGDVIDRDNFAYCTFIPTILSSSKEVDNNGDPTIGDSPSFYVDAGKFYILLTKEYAASDGTYRGHHMYCYTKPPKSGAAPQSIEIAKSSNTGVTISISDETVRVRASSSSYRVDMTVIVIPIGVPMDPIGS